MSKENIKEEIIDLLGELKELELKRKLALDRFNYIEDEILELHKEIFTLNKKIEE